MMKMDETERARRGVDETESIRRAYITSGLVDEDLKDVEAAGEKTWSTAEMTAEFDVVGFMAPFVVVRRKDNGIKGTLEFRHSPRVYFGWKEDTHGPGADTGGHR